MRDRRRHQRFEVAARPGGELRYLSPVEIVRVDEDQVVVMAEQAAVPGETLVFRDRFEPGAPIDARITACRPVIEGGRVRFEVRLSLLDPAAGAEA